MKLLTNENNTNTMKIVISSAISEKPVEISLCSLETFPRGVPQLILDSGTRFFSSNAAAKFLFLPTPQEATAVNYYLDFEATVIQPLLAFFNSKLNDSIRKYFDDILLKLEEELQTKAYLTGDKVSVGDIALWSTLYPLFTDSKMREELLTSKKLLRNWFECIYKSPEVQIALKLYTVQEGVVSLGNFITIQCKKLSHGTSKMQHSGANFTDTSLARKAVTNGGNNTKGQESPIKEPLVMITECERNEATLSWMEKPKRFPKLSVHPVLPKPGEKNVLITSALPYVNNVPHLGNIIGCVLSGDVFARYSRLRGYNTLYICGTDEYGTATETKALEEKLTPQEICDKYFKIHDSIYKWFNISFDHFGRTTTPQQTEICQDIFKKIYKNGYIVADSVEQLLCENCDRYLADRFVEGTCPRCGFDDARGDQCDGCGHLINAPELIKPRCKMCQKTPVLRHSKQFFLDLPKIEPLLREWINRASMTWSHNAREISKAWLNDGLKPRCITRDLKWGIPVPLEGFQNKVFYVWFDAPIGYISITKLYTENWQKWWMPDKNTEVSLYQFMAKDNVPFHSVMFPASLLAAKENYVLANYIFATEYLNYEDGKFSKSRGVGVFGTDAQDTEIPADIWRFYLLYVRPENQDSSFSWLDLAMKNNSELLSTLGNFINRALVFCEKNYRCKVPKMYLGKEDYDLLVLVNRELAEYISALEKGKLREGPRLCSGIKHMLAIARLGNQYMQSSQPWVLCKGTDDEKKRCGTVIGISINLSCLLSQLIHPYMPETSDVIRKQLNSPPEINVIEDKFRLLLPTGHQIGKPFPVFNKIETEHIEKLKLKFCGRQKSNTPASGESSRPGSSKNDSTADVESLEVAVAAQGNVVRTMKAAGKDKSEWGPQVTILLDLKKKLADAQKQAKIKESILSSPTSSGSVNAVDQLQEVVKKQCDAVRKLKESGAERLVWQPEVNVLLQLKKELAELKGETLENGRKKKQSK